LIEPWRTASTKNRIACHRQIPPHTAIIGTVLAGVGRGRAWISLAVRARGPPDVRRCALGNVPPCCPGTHLEG
jgi:CTP-dependent riboflavin kinase